MQKSAGMQLLRKYWSERFSESESDTVTEEEDSRARLSLGLVAVGPGGQDFGRAGAKWQMLDWAEGTQEGAGVLRSTPSPHCSSYPPLVAMGRGAARCLLNIWHLIFWY